MKKILWIISALIAVTAVTWVIFESREGRYASSYAAPQEIPAPFSPPISPPSTTSTATRSGVCQPNSTARASARNRRQMGAVTSDPTAPSQRFAHWGSPSN